MSNAAKLRQLLSALSAGLAIAIAPVALAAPADAHRADDPPPQPEPEPTPDPEPEPEPQPEPDPTPEPEPEPDPIPDPTPEPEPTPPPAPDEPMPVPPVPDEPAVPEAPDEPEAEAPAPTERVLAITGATVHTVTGPTLRGYTILTKDNTIDRIGRNLTIPDHATVIDATGMHVYPGLIALRSSRFIGNPPQDATDPYDLTMLLALAGGITTAFDNGNVAKLTYGSLDEHFVRDNVFIDISYTTNNPQNRKRLRESLEAIRSYDRDKAAYDRRKASNPELDEEPPDESVLRGRNARLVPLARGQRPAFARAHTAYDMLELARLAENFGFQLIIEGAREAWTIAPELARANVSVIINARNRVPPNERSSRPTGSSIENAAILHRHGIRVGITAPGAGIGTGGITGRENLNLNLEAGFAVRGGLPEDAAVRSITIDAARILGIDDRVGSIEPGKDADLIITSQPLIRYTSNVEYAIVNGRIVYDKDMDTLFNHIRPREGSEAEPPKDEWPRRLERPWRR